MGWEVLMPCTGPTLVLVLLLSVASPVSADPLRLRTDGDIYTLYERLQPGMTVKEVTAVIGDGRLREAPDTVTAWVIWSPPMTGRATAVVRALFRDGRLLRVNYELFGEEYRRLIKGGDGDVIRLKGSSACSGPRGGSSIGTRSSVTMRSRRTIGWCSTGGSG
jgi:hypothetical protein